MQVISWRYHYSIFNFLFKSKNVGEDGWKLQKIQYLKNQNSVLSEIKSIFHYFLRAFF